MKSEAVPSSADALKEIILMERLCGIPFTFILCGHNLPHRHLKCPGKVGKTLLIDIVLSLVFSDFKTKKSWAMKENKNLLMSKKSELHKLTIPEALPAKFLRPSKILSFGKADSFWFPFAGIWFTSHEKKALN